jgi:adenosine deaminase
MDHPIPNWCERIPKVELHLHLEGAIPLPTMWQLIQKYGGNTEIPDLDSLTKKFTFTNFSHFIQTWIWMTQFLREYEDFTLIGEAIARDLAQQNIRYVEAFFSPGDFARHKLTPQGIAAALREGLDRVPQIHVALIADLIRDSGPDVEKAMNTLHAVNEVRDQGVIGIGLGGSEQKYPAQLFKSVFAEARQLWFHTTAHAGEAAGPESVWAALESLRVERIGHGIRSIEDLDLVKTLAQIHIPLEVCPISNVRTGVVKSIEEHPIRRLYDLGVVVTINTDDPKMFGNSLAEEYATLVDKLGFTKTEVKSLILQGIQSSWLEDSDKQSLKLEFQNDPNWKL